MYHQAPIGEALVISPSSGAWQAEAGKTSKGDVDLSIVLHPPTGKNKFTGPFNSVPEERSTYEKGIFNS